MRERKTWRQAGRKASAPPATPGYGTEDQDHPAHEPDPAYEAYKKGDPSAWAEDPHQPPYPEGNPPADPGYDTEDQDHPAHQRPPRVPKEASLRQAVERKAAKCMAIATKMLPKTASSQMIEDQALDLLDMPDTQLDATFERFGGDFFGYDELLDEEVVEDEAFPVEDEGLEELLAQDEEEDFMVEETMSPAMAMFDEMDMDNDGFITADDWTGSKAIFASIDTDGDGIVARDEVLAAFGGKKVQADLDITAEERKMLAEMEEEEEEEEAKKSAAKKSEDEDEEADEGSDKEAGCEKLPEGPMRDNCEGKKDDGKKEDKKAADEDDDGDEDEGSDKEACTFDPMGLDDGELPEDDIDDALIEEVFGTRAAAKKSDDDEDDDDSDEEVEVEESEEVEEDDDGDDKEAKKKASERPQRPKRATGPKTVGKMTRTASSDVDDLSALWESAPDVSDVFGS